MLQGPRVVAIIGQLEPAGMAEHVRADRERHVSGFPEPPLWCVELEKWPYHTDAWKRWLSDTRAGKNPPLPVAE